MTAIFSKRKTAEYAQTMLREACEARKNALAELDQKNILDATYKAQKNARYFRTNP